MLEDYTNAVFEDIDYADYPDFVDSVLMSCDFKCVDMTESEIEDLDPSIIHELLLNYIT